MAENYLPRKSITYHYRHVLLAVYFIFFLLGPTLELLGYERYREYSLLLSKYTFLFPADTSQFTQAYIYTLICLIALAIGLFIKKPKIICPSIISNIPFRNIFYLTLVLSAVFSTYIITNSVNNDAVHGLSAFLQKPGSNTSTNLLESRLVFLVVYCFYTEKLIQKVRNKSLSAGSALIYSTPIMVYVVSVFFSGTRSLILEPLGIIFVSAIIQYFPSISPLKLYLSLSTAFVIFNSLSNYYLLTRLADSEITLESYF